MHDAILYISSPSQQISNVTYYCTPQKFYFWKTPLHLTNWASWNNRHKINVKRTQLHFSKGIDRDESDRYNHLLKNLGPTSSWICSVVPRLAYKSSSNFFYEREARAVDFYVFCGKSERESERGTNQRNRKWEAKDFEKVYVVSSSTCWPRLKKSTGFPLASWDSYLICYFQLFVSVLNCVPQCKVINVLLVMELRLLIVFFSEYTVHDVAL